MASLTAARARLLPWLKLLPLNNDSFLSHFRISKELSRNYHISTTQSKPVLCEVRTSQQVINYPSKLCLCFQKQALSSAALHIPQVDLDTEEKDQKKRKGSENGVSASDVLQNLSPEEARKLKIIKLEFDVMEQMYGKVPEVMTDENWLHALQLDTKSQRLRYYRFLRKNEKIKESKKRKQEVKQQQPEAEIPFEKKEAAFKNSIFFTIREAAFKKAGNYRLAHAMQFGQPLVFDMDYEQYMRHQDCQNLVFQLLLSYSKNRDARNPFHFIFTSLDPHGKVLRMLRHANLAGPHFMGTMTDKSYLDLFPREQLLYLSPHAGQCLKEVNTDDVYIIGGIVDKVYPKPLSLARAKEQGIRVAKFPLDNYLLWGSGSKSLTLDQVMAILLEQRRSKDWNQAFKSIPERKLHREDS